MFGFNLVLFSYETLINIWRRSCISYILCQIFNYFFQLIRFRSGQRTQTLFGDLVVDLCRHVAGPETHGSYHVSPMISLHISHTGCSLHTFYIMERNLCGNYSWVIPCVTASASHSRMNLPALESGTSDWLTTTAITLVTFMNKVTIVLWLTHCHSILQQFHKYTSNNNHIKIIEKCSCFTFRFISFPSLLQFHVAYNKPTKSNPCYF